MLIRRYTKADVPALVGTLELGLKDYHYGARTFAPQKVADLLLGNLRNPSFGCWVVEKDGVVGGALVAGIYEYVHSYEVYAEPYITLILPEFRGLAAITGLVAEYVRWAKSRGAVQIRWGQSSGYKVEKFAILAKRLGFEQIGTTWNMETGL
jgi:GNAT superfamily N-acetyltransferase